MDPPYGAILLLAIFSILAIMLPIRQARRKGEKIHYLGAVVGCVMLSVIALALLNQPLLAFILLVAGGLPLIAMLPKAMAVQKREMNEQLTKAIEETDLSEPMRLRDFMKWKGWLKLAHRWGVWKTAAIYSLISMAVIAGVTYTAFSVFHTMNIWLVAGYTIPATIIIFIWFYRQTSKALKETKKN